MKTEFDLTLVLACFNEEPVFVESVRTIFDVLDITNLIWEIIFVDDCSRDRTRELIHEVIHANPHRNLSCILHDKNMGRGRTVSEGLQAARGSVVGYVDIDLEVHARYITACVLAVKNGADIATAYRVYKFYWRGLVRWTVSHGYMWLEQWLLNVPLRDTETGFKFFRRERILPILDEIEDERWFWDTEVMVRSFLKGYQIEEIPCLFQRRFDKRSTVNVLGDSLDYFGKLWRFRKTVAQIRSRQ